MIAGCGCTIVSRGRYSVGGPLSQTGASDCIKIDASGVDLDLVGYSVTGPAAPALFDVGVHVTRRASGATIVGGGATISHFTIALLIEGGGATVSGLSANGDQNGIIVNGPNADLTNFSASDNDSDGVDLFGASNAVLSDFTASGNIYFGIDIISKGSEMFGFTANSNGYAGVVISSLV
jgi:hypothetical protein